MQSAIASTSMAGMVAMTNAAASADPTSILNNQLASALSTIGDAQFWEETISPSTIRSSLSNSDPSSPNSTPELQRGMKWLLASISKGRDVSDFYPHVVKLVGAHSLEVRKMVYMYLVHYADHDATTRELSLLSINSFQRGLADIEQLIRALALRVLSSIRIPDILQIQILAVERCSKDRSPYVRKCAANALAKLNPRCDPDQKQSLLTLMQRLINDETCTMVLTSALIAFAELCPDRLELLHQSYRKICHLLTDMDEWGQVVILDILARYCRTFFRQPRAWKDGTAERIDRERRVWRTVSGIANNEKKKASSGGDMLVPTLQTTNTNGGTNAEPVSQKRRVYKQGFYSDEEDGSTDEEAANFRALDPSKQRNILGLPGVPTVAINMDADEDNELDGDHQLLIQSAMPLLKSRNAGVVLAVCSLLYYCGVSSVKSRSAIGKALVRIHRDRREIQYVVLTSIQTLVTECPSAFAPFLNDFFVKAMDPPFTAIIKVDILTSLALEPAAIEAVLKELRTYIRHSNKLFVCAAIRAVGRVAELTQIVHERHGRKSGDISKELRAANRISLDCLYGLATLSQSCTAKSIVGEAVIVMQNIFSLLLGSSQLVDDPNKVQSFAMRRILLLLINTLSTRNFDESGADDDDGSDNGDTNEGLLKKTSVDLPPRAVAAALWFVGEWLSLLSLPPHSPFRLDDAHRSAMRISMLKLIDRAYTTLESSEKYQSIHFASKMLASNGSSQSNVEKGVCEHILAMGRTDVTPDVRDRARHESAALNLSKTINYDMDAIENIPSGLDRSLTPNQCQKIFLAPKLRASYLPIDDAEETGKVNSFRFGTLSSLVGHQARGSYLRLPPWAKKDSPKYLRDPQEAAKEMLDSSWKTKSNGTGASQFYDNNSNGSTGDGSSSSSGSSSDDEDSESDDSSSDGSDSDDSDSSSSGDNEDIAENTVNFLSPNASPPAHAPAPKFNSAAIPTPVPRITTVKSSSNDDSTSDGSDSDSESESSSDSSDSGAAEGTLFFMEAVHQTPANGSSAIDDLRGLVMAPVIVEDGTKTADSNSRNSEWVQLVRPELCGGLSLRGRYLRGSAKAREVVLKGLDPESSSLICLQLEFANRKPDSSSLRRIRLLPLTSPNGSIGTKKVVCPPEISELKKDQVSSALLCIDFVKPSDRDGDLVARLDVKSAIGGVPIVIKPPLGELLRPCNKKVAEFDATMKQMQGFQRVTTTCVIESSSKAALPDQILKSGALSPVGKSGWKDGKLRYAGKLPASGDFVYILVESPASSSSVVITVCCDNAVAVNNILAMLKSAVTNE